MMCEVSPVISIVTPCYNAGRFIKETIDSVLAQSFTSWEMLIVDDCSTDNSAEVIQSYNSIDSRIKYYRTDKNTGSPAIPRNIGIEHAQGRYIAFLDSDDIWYPDKLKDQVELMMAKPCGVCYTDGVMINEAGEILRTMRKADWVDYRRTLKRNELSCSSVVIDKSIIGNLKFQNMPKEDFAFWIELMKLSGEVAYNTGRVSYAYRLVGNSRSRNKGSIIKQQWHVLRHVARLGLFDAAYCFGCWALRNVKKYYMN